MPAVPYQPRPFVPDRYEPRSRLADFARHRGDIEADSIRRSGDISAALWSGIGENVAQTLGQIAQIPVQRQQAKLLEQRALREEQEYKAAQQAQQSEAQKAERLKGLTQMYGGRVPSDVLVQEFGPQDAMEISKAFDSIFPQPKAPEPFTLGEGQTRFGGDGQTIASVPKPPPVAPVEKPPTVGSFEDYLLTKFGPRPTPEQIEAGRKAYQQADDRPLRINTPPPKRALTPNMEATLIRQMNNRWTQASAPARELDRQAKMMDVGMTSARKGDLAQGAQVVLVTFQKILDPPSVVRESEFMRSAAGQSLINRVKGAYDRLTVGGAGITLPELEKFASLAREAAEAQKSGYLPAEKARIGKMAERYEIPAELVFEQIEEAPAPAAPAGDYLSTDPNFGTPVAPVKPKGGQ